MCIRDRVSTQSTGVHHRQHHQRQAADQQQNMCPSPSPSNECPSPSIVKRSCSSRRSSSPKRVMWSDEDDGPLEEIRYIENCLAQKRWYQRISPTTAMALVGVAAWYLVLVAVMVWMPHRVEQLVEVAAQVSEHVNLARMLNTSAVVACLVWWAQKFSERRSDLNL
eukprot:TRINITY_DN789_c0_g1_i1.p1 TRINITY_DN789_c0_g1~~TRINITY_DN789_c0_g1_i1.p1  ORF type:complete len:166 (-),score=15.67 TRINITY_DN789_c0_g1_i1:31-528(-)